MAAPSPSQSPTVTALPGRPTSNRRPSTSIQPTPMRIDSGHPSPSTSADWSVTAGGQGGTAATPSTLAGIGASGRDSRAPNSPAEREAEAGDPEENRARREA